jgi:hypothetical protein
MLPPETSFASRNERPRHFCLRARAGASAARFLVELLVGPQSRKDNTQRPRAEVMAFSSEVRSAKVTVPRGAYWKAIPSVAQCAGNRSTLAGAGSAWRGALHRLFSGPAPFLQPSQVGAGGFGNRRGRTAISWIPQNPLCRVNRCHPMSIQYIGLLLHRASYYPFLPFLGGPVAPSP